MATVIRLLADYNMGAHTVESVPTWTPRSRLTTTGMFASALTTLHRMGTDQVAHIHLSERGSFLREGLLIALAHRRGLVTVVTIHGAAFVSFAREHPVLVSAVLSRADVVTCLEQHTLDCVRRAAPLVRSEIMPNPVLVDASFGPADRTDEVVVFAGEIGLRKGADVLCRAWSLVADRRPMARCLMVGPTTSFTPPGAERLEVRPPVEQSEIKEILRSARVIALPARAEAMPMVLVEAMSLARPFVSTPVGGVPELAEGGLLVPVDDELGLADQLTKLLANPDLARGLGERGRRFCAETRSIEVIDGLLRKLYSTAVAEKCG